MDYKDVIAELEKLTALGWDFELKRTRAMLDALSSPDKKLKIIHIAGTNGKGSTAEYLTQILVAAGFNVGTFTSPAVYSYLEQFRVDGKSIDKTIFCEAAEEVLTLAGEATKFEVETVIALYAFVLAGCEYAVVECGLGGTYDATNAIAGKELALITSISLEHTKILGNTLESICKHKAGIIKKCPAIISGYNEASVLEFFGKYGATVAEKYDEAPIYGEAQKYNAGLAIAAAKYLGIEEALIYYGVKRAKLAGRMEILHANGLTYVLDGAHNPQSFSPLSEYLKANAKAEDTAVIYGCLSDKDINSAMQALSSVTEKIIAVEPFSCRAMPLTEIYAVCRKYFKNADAAASVENALEVAESKTVVVCGSFTLLKEAKSWIEKRS